MSKFHIEATFSIEANNADEALGIFDLGMKYLDWSGPSVDVQPKETRDEMRKRLGITKRECEND